MKRVLYIGGFELPDKNAAAQRVMANGKLLRMMGYDVSFIGVTKEKGFQQIDSYEGFNSMSIEYPTNTKKWLYYILIFVPFDVIRSYNPDYVILYNFPAVASLRILKYCHQHNITVFHDVTEWEQTDGYTPRDLIKRLDTVIRMKYCNKRMDGVIAISHYLYDYYEKKVNTILVPPTVDLTDKKWDRDRVITSSEVVKLVYAGSANSKTKDRLDYVINAVTQVKNISFAIVGMTEGDYERVFGRLPEEHSNITFLGKISHREAIKEVASADFQMLIRNDSLKNRAGFPTKFVESMSCCTPVIATLSSNLKDYLFEGKNGFVVDDYHPLKLVLNKVSQLSPGERDQMKYYCRDNNGFDYRYFQIEFSKLFLD